jgi:poly(3-hydroxyalkanoate) depolymerase
MTLATQSFQKQKAESLMGSQAGVVRQAGMHTVSIKGQRLRVMIRPGNATRTPLVLMNGLGVGLEVLRPFQAELDPSIEVMSFDVPGIGGSPAPALPYSPAALACLVEDLLAELGYAWVDVLGVSWGGWLAQQFALQYRRRCRRLILVCSSPGAFMVPGLPNAAVSLLTPWRYADPAYLEQLAPALFGGAPQSNPQRLCEFIRSVRANWPRGYFYQLFAGVGWSSLPWLWLMQQPALVLAGDDDHMAPASNARIMHSLIPRAQLSIYHGGHLDILTDPREIMPGIERFLARADG